MPFKKLASCVCIIAKGKILMKKLSIDRYCHLSQELKNVTHSLDFKFGQIFNINTFCDILSQL